MSDPQPVSTMAEAETPPSEPAYDPAGRNVVVVVLDDLGFAQMGCYGSDLETPALDGLAARGLRFTNFHTTAICSPTRACLLTGRNHHRVGMGMLPDLPTNFPGYTGVFPRSAGTLAEILRTRGYATYCVGKWHLTPRDQRSTGPFRMWPLGCGFDRYYGFLNGETNQWTPNLVRDNTHIEPPAAPEDGYHLDADLADQAIAYLRDLRTTDPVRPFLLWYATASPHAPHQAPTEWIERFRGRFDDGWDAWREKTLARQKAMGIVDPDVTLSARPAWIEPWDDLDDDHRRLYARMMEVFAGFLAHADHQLGRLVHHLEHTGEMGRTVVVVVSDNGTSGEGGPHGTYNQMGHYISDDEDDVADEMAHIDDLGGHRSSGHYPWGWALAGNTPLRRWKRYTFEGGVRDPMLVVAPDLGHAAGGIRDHYVHAVDVMPTVLDMVGIDAPATLDGVEQMSFDGASFRKVIDDSGADDTRTTQYYECWGSRAIYHDGWKAVTDHVNQLTVNERTSLAGSHDFATDRWALYDTRTDPTERNDLSDADPDRLADLIDRWHDEADRNGVLPIDDGAANRIRHLHLPWVAHRSRFDLAPGDKVHEAHGPMLAGGFRMIATFDPPLDGVHEPMVLCEQGDELSGWAWFVAGGVATWQMSVKGGPYTASIPVAAGVRLITVAGSIDEGRLTIETATDRTEPARTRLSVGVPLAWSPDGAFLTVGYARAFTVSEAYTPPALAPANLAGVRIDVGQPPPFDIDAELARAMRHQ